MTYRIAGLDPQAFQPLFGLADQELAARGVVRMTATDRPGFPCRVTLDDAAVGAQMLLLNHVSHDVANPYRTSHAIFVTEGASAAAEFIDEVPQVLDRRPLSLRAFDAAGMMCDALLVESGGSEEGIRRLLDKPETAYIHAHNAIRGCFAAKVARC